MYCVCDERMGRHTKVLCLKRGYVGHKGIVYEKRGELDNKSFVYEERLDGPERQVPSLTHDSSPKKAVWVGQKILVCEERGSGPKKSRV